jgi:hypothetical protein
MTGIVHQVSGILYELYIGFNEWMQMKIMKRDGRVPKV